MSRDDRHINVCVDVELDAYVRDICKRSDMTVSQLVRDALRAYFHATKSPLESGWREGYTAGYRTVMEAVKTAFASLPPDPPPAIERAAPQGRMMSGPK